MKTLGQWLSERQEAVDGIIAELKGVEGLPLSAHSLRIAASILQKYPDWVRQEADKIEQEMKSR